MHSAHRMGAHRISRSMPTTHTHASKRTLKTHTNTLPSTRTPSSTHIQACTRARSRAARLALTSYLEPESRTASAAQRGARRARASRGCHTVHALGWSGALPRLLCVACCIAPAPTDGLASPCLRSTRGAQPALVALAHLQQKRFTQLIVSTPRSTASTLHRMLSSLRSTTSTGYTRPAAPAGSRLS